MAVVKAKPTSAGRRFVVKVVDSELHKGAPHKALISPQKKSGGRNNQGHITTRHRGGGHKRLYRRVDFLRNKDGVPARVATIEYDPNRSARIALLHYRDGEKRYILAPRDMQVGTMVMSGPTADPKPGNSMALSEIPVGLAVHNIELIPGRGAKLVRQLVELHYTRYKRDQAPARPLHHRRCAGAQHGWQTQTGWQPCGRGGSVYYSATIKKSYYSHGPSINYVVLKFEIVVVSLSV